MRPSACYLDREIPDLRGKCILISGATSGIGKEAALALAYKNAELIIACRSPEKADKALAEIQKEVGSAKISFVYYEQSDPMSIAHLVAILKNRRLDAIVLNAGVYFPEKGARSADGTSSTFQTNAVGTYLLFRALFADHPHSRYVFVNSVLNLSPRNDDYSLYVGQDLFSRGHTYGVSKRAVMNIFAYASSLPDCDATMTHPGVSKTEIIRCFAPWIKRAGNAFLYLFAHPAWKAALGIVRLASGIDEKGTYLTPRGFAHLYGYPKVSLFPSRKCRHLYKDFIALMNRKYGI